MKVLACAIGFGLGPSGKLCSIIEDNTRYEWVACGDKLDLSLFKKDPFIECCWTRDRKNIRNLIISHNIKYAIVVLDPEIAVILTEIGVKVIYVDSLPFMWTDADILPYEVYCYCAQDYPCRITNTAMNKVKNLVWVKPITPVFASKNTSTSRSIVINYGGLHSPYGEGIEYYKTMMNAILPCFSPEEIIVLGGENVLNLTKSLYPSIECATLSHEAFLNTVASSKTFITSPGLTTIYETYTMDIKTIIMPPQNLSQFYNADIAKQICRKVLVLDWNNDRLNQKALAQFNSKSEEETVRYIYGEIKNMSENSNFTKMFSEYVSSRIAKEKYTLNYSHKMFSEEKEISEIITQIIEQE